MAAVTIHLWGYDTGNGNKPGIVVNIVEERVQLDLQQIDDSYPSMSPEEARALAAVLIAQANEAES